VTVSNHPSTHKKSSSKSHANPSTPEATPPPTPASSRAAKALAQLDAIESMLNLDIIVRPNDKHQVHALNRVSDTAIGLASDIVSAAPERLPDFADLPAASAYVGIYAQVASRAQELATHIQKSVQNQRTPAANKTLALYAVVKSLGRITDNETMREKVAALKAEIAPKRKSPKKPKVTKEEKAAKRLADSQAKKVAKAKDVLLKAGELPTPAPIPAPAPVADPAPATPPVTAPAVAPANGVTPANGTPVASH
jgi:hypothetical protein